MILVRDLLRIDPAQMKNVRQVVLESLPTMKTLDYPPLRVMTDMVGEYYALVLESEFSDIGAWERALAGTFASPEWQAFYGKIRGAVRGGRREIYTILA